MIDDREMLDLIITWLPTGGKVLDVGCAGGEMLMALAERGIRGTGIDPQARDSKHCLSLKAEEMEGLTGPYDLVYTRYTLHHLDMPQQFAWKARSVLRPGGILLIVDWIERAQTGVSERYFPIERVSRWVREAGFHILREGVREQSLVIIAKFESEVNNIPGS
jgi:2-polyprenyl-3-methyl-5-hydroxy-6-metoxy-1,4-benzoquinol methylase